MATYCVTMTCCSCKAISGGESKELFGTLLTRPTQRKGCHAGMSGEGGNRVEEGGIQVCKLRFKGVITPHL